MTKIMGSLPNLHELSKGKLDNPVFNPAPIGGLRPAKLPAQPPPLAHTHRRARSGGHHHNVLCDNEAMLEVFYKKNREPCPLAVDQTYTYILSK